ncbi:MAG: NADP-dependent malic enzyme [Candidatus Nanoarchaeia archaeon]|jgi:malate dehydrogenase (oxaloacetate-decarboxylating)
MVDASKVFDYHKNGKLSINAKPICNKEELSLAYTPGVAIACLEIKDHPERVWDLTWRSNTIIVLSDGSRVLGLGNIGPEAGLPVMEGKAQLFKELGGVNAVPICLGTTNEDEIVSVAKALAPSFGGINLEDIASPRCFNVERRLIEALDIPVFHDDQHGTAVIVLAGLKNALKLKSLNLCDARIVMSGAGSAGYAITKLLVKAGAKNVLVLDSKGIININNELPAHKLELAKITNPLNLTGGLKEAITGADVFIGASKPNSLPPELIKLMNDKPVIFALCNPVPEIDPDLAKQAGAFIVATGRSDRPNQINNVLGFPGIFRGLLDVRARKVTDEIKLAAAEAIAGIVGDKLSPDYIVPEALDKRVMPVVAEAVRRTAREQGLARK